MTQFLHGECAKTDFPSRVLVEGFWASLMQVPCVACSDRLVMQASGSCCWIMRVARSQSHPAAANCLKWPTSEKGYSRSQKTAGKLAGAGIRTETMDENVGEIWSGEGEEEETMHSWPQVLFYFNFCSHWLGWRHTSLLLGPIKHQLCHYSQI